MAVIGTMRGRMTSPTVANRVKEILSDHLGSTIDNPSDSLEHDHTCDSLDRIEIGFAIEREFGINYDEDKAGAWKTVGDVIEFVEQNGK